MRTSSLLVKFQPYSRLLLSTRKKCRRVFQYFGKIATPSKEVFGLKNEWFDSGVTLYQIELISFKARNTGILFRHEFNWSGNRMNITNHFYPTISFITQSSLNWSGKAYVNRSDFKSCSKKIERILKTTDHYSVN